MECIPRIFNNRQSTVDGDPLIKKFVQKTFDFAFILSIFKCSIESVVDTIGVLLMPLAAL